MNMRSHQITRHVVNDGVIRLALCGEFDMACVDELREALGTVIEGEQAAEVLVDLDQTTFIDSQTIRVLVWGYHTARSTAARLQVINPHGIVRRVLEVTGVWEQLGSGRQSGDA